MRVERVADRNLFISADQRVGHAPGDAFLQEQAARGGAALSGGAHRAEQNRAQRQIEVGVIHHDDAVVAAQLQNGAAQPCATLSAPRGGPPGWSR